MWYSSKLPQLTHTCHILVTSNDSSVHFVQTLFSTKCAKYFQMSKDDGYELCNIVDCIKIGIEWGIIN